MLGSLQKRLSALEISIRFTGEAVAALAKEGFDPVYGARPLRRAVQSRVEDELAEQLLQGRWKAGSRIACDFREGKFVFLPQA